MAQKLVTESHALARTLDKSRDIRHNKGASLPHSDNPQNRCKGGEMVIRNFRLSLTHHRNKGGFSDIRKAY